MLDATKSQFRDVTFETVDLTDKGGSNQEVAQKYNITGIPAVVMLDSSGKVLYNNNPPFSVEALSQIINQFR